MLTPALLALALFQSPIAIVHGRIIDGNGGPPIEDGTVVVRGDRIVAVGPSRSTAVPAGARVVEAGGRSVLPGLIDAHIHLMGGWDGVTVDMLGIQRSLDALLASGVTTTLDLGNSLPYVQQIRQELAAGRLTGPRLLMAGALIDGPNPIWPPISFATSADSQVAGFVDQLVRAKADVVKAYGGLTTPQIGLVVQEAKKRGLRVLVDAWGRNGTLDVARTGIASFAHAGGEPITDETVSYMKEHDVASITTLVVFESFTRRRLDRLGFLDQPLLVATFPKSYREELTAFARRPVDAAAETQNQGRLRTAMANVKRLHEAGILLAAGTDAPYPGDYYGEGLHRELELLVEAGLTPVQAIGVATRNGARLFQLDDRGTLAVGRRADLLLVRGDPTTRIADTKNVELVMQGGRIVDRAALIRRIAAGPDFRPAGSTAH
jgi:imidazolonepropionase-like amidohydrolase